MDPSNLRRSPRIRLQMPVFLRAADTSGAEFIELTKTLNISSTGACVASTHILRPTRSSISLSPLPPPLLRESFPARLRPSPPESSVKIPPAKCGFLGWNSSSHLSKVLPLWWTACPDQGRNVTLAESELQPYLIARPYTQVNE